MSTSVAVLGASGYAGGELVRLLDEHPSFDVVFLGAHQKAGASLRSVHPHLRNGERVLQSSGELPEVDLAFLALPHGASAEPGMRLASAGRKVIDLGSDFRLDSDERYQQAYGSPHPDPSTLQAWMYGLPELVDVTDAALVAAPGCYPTATLLALVPLIASELIDPASVVVDALSGVSGAGRSLREDLLFGSVDEGVRAYAVGRHRHRPEIEMGLEVIAGVEARVTFTPHLIPMLRGILSTVTAPLAKDVSREEILDRYREWYRDCPFVQVLDDEPQTRWVVGSNRVALGAAVDRWSGRVVAMAAIDNLLKGAAGQAVQVANLMFGLDETEGLPLAGWMP